MSVAIFPFTLGEEYGEGFIDETLATQMGGGREVRSPTFASVGRFEAEGSLRIPQGSNTHDTLAAFVRARRGRYDTFLYLPAYSYNRKSVSEAVGTGNGVATLFALDYLYPKTGSFTATVNGVASVEGAGWSLADSEGNSWTLGEAPYMKFAAPVTNNHAIVATYEFYVPVRFEDDDLMRRLGVDNHNSTSASITAFLDRLGLRQDYAGSHLVTVPSP